MPTSTNKDTVERYLDGFRRMDHAQILGCLTDDITWTVFGAFRLEGKAAYDAAIDGSGFSGNPDLTVVRLVEEGDTVMAEMIGSVPRDDGRCTGSRRQRCSCCATGSSASVAPGWWS